MLLDGFAIRCWGRQTFDCGWLGIRCIYSSFYSMYSLTLLHQINLFWTISYTWIEPKQGVNIPRRRKTTWCCNFNQSFSSLLPLLLKNMDFYKIENKSRLWKEGSILLPGRLSSIPAFPPHWFLGHSSQTCCLILDLFNLSEIWASLIVKEMQFAETHICQA